jgi:hypothetical protein
MITVYNSLGKILFANNSDVLEVTNKIIEEQTVLGNFYLEDYIDVNKFYIVDGTPVEIPNQPSSYHVFNYTTKQWDENIALAEQSVKAIKNQLLQESDWTDTVSAQTRLGETLYNAWQDYRQQLRDISLQSGYPLEVIYPEPPVS